MTRLAVLPVRLHYSGGDGHGGAPTWLVRVAGRFHSGGYARGGLPVSPVGGVR